MTKTEYKGQLIAEDNGKVTFFLCDEEGDIYENDASSIEDAKAKIDKIETEQGGLHNLGGQLMYS